MVISCFVNIDCILETFLFNCVSLVCSLHSTSVKFYVSEECLDFLPVGLSYCSSEKTKECLKPASHSTMEQVGTRPDTIQPSSTIINNTTVELHRVLFSHAVCGRLKHILLKQTLNSIKLPKFKTEYENYP